MRERALLSAIVVGLLVGALAGGTCYWLASPKGIHFSRVETSVWVGLLAAVATAWAHHKSRALQMIGHYDARRGYYRMHLGNCDMCFSSSKERVPGPFRPSGVELIGKAHCLIDDEFWVWRETCSHGTANADDTRLA